MNHSKFVLSTTTCLLAMAAFAFSKAHNNPSTLCTATKCRLPVGNDFPCSTINSSNLKTVNGYNLTCYAGPYKLVMCGSCKTVYMSTIN